MNRPHEISLINCISLLSVGRAGSASRRCGAEGSSVVEFRFAFLNERRQMFLSDPLVWKSNAAKVVAFLDHILRKAIESSPHTTPVKKNNRQLDAC